MAGIASRKVHGLLWETGRNAGPPAKQQHAQHGLQSRLQHSSPAACFSSICCRSRGSARSRSTSGRRARRCGTGACPFTEPSIIRPPFSLQPRRCPRPVAPLAAGRTLVAVVLLLMGSLFVIAVGALLPPLVSAGSFKFLHAPLAVVLTFNVVL